MAVNNLSPSVVSRKDAISQGLKFYFTGEPCPQGHIANRYICGPCVLCNKSYRQQLKKIDPDYRKRESRKYREQHPDRRKNTTSEYYRRNKDKILARQAKQYRVDPRAFLDKAERWRKNNLAKVAAAERIHRAANPEKSKARDKRARERNRDKVLERTRKWRKANPDKVRAYQREYEATHRDPKKVAARVLRWLKRNPEKRAAMHGRRRARKLGAEGSYAAADIQQILTAQNGLCVGIGCVKNISKRYTVDHVMPLSRGGSNWPSNLQLLCRACNASKGVRTMDEWLAAKSQRRSK